MDWFEEYDINDVKNINGVKDVETISNSGSSEFQMANVSFFLIKQLLPY